MRVENQVENGMILIRHVLGSQKRISGSDLWDLDPGSAGIIDPPSQIVDGSTGIIDPSSIFVDGSAWIRDRRHHLTLGSTGRFCSDQFDFVDKYLSYGIICMSDPVGSKIRCDHRSIFIVCNGILWDPISVAKFNRKIHWDPRSNVVICRGIQWDQRSNIAFYREILWDHRSYFQIHAHV